MLTTHHVPFITSLITGVNGFVGVHLAEHLASRRRTVIGLDIQDRCVIEGGHYFQGDVRDSRFISEVFKKTRPQEIYHLAAVSSPNKFASAPFDSFQINLMGTISQLEAMKTICPHSIMLVVGSAKQYQPLAASRNLSENSPLDPASYYGVSKNAIEMITKFYVHKHSLDIRLTRSFNHTGPNQSVDFVCSEWAHQIARIESLKAPPQISVGNTEEVIDFCDVRDVVEAYRLICEKGSSGEVYNVCSGKGTSLRYVLEYLLGKSSLKSSIIVKRDKTDKQALNAAILGDNQKIRKEIGWSPNIPIEKTLDDLYCWWLDKMKDPR